MEIANHNNNLEFQVSDTGIGVKEVENLFKMKLTKTDPNSPDISGIGLGLYIA